MDSLRSLAARLLGTTFLRYFAVTLGGLALDLGTAYLLHRLAGVPLATAALCGMLLGAVAVYLGHVRWSFAVEEERYAPLRILRFALGVALVLAIRELLLWLFAYPLGLGDRYAALQLIAAAGVSFLCNYGVSRYWIFTAEKNS